MSLYESVEYEELRAVLADFYARVYGDVMIGFLFRSVDRERLIELADFLDEVSSR